MRDCLVPQDCLYTVLTKGESGASAQVIGSISEYMYAPDSPEAVLAKLCSPHTHLVSMTVTEKGYCFDEASGCLDLSHPTIAHDLENPTRPNSAIGYVALVGKACSEESFAGTL